MPATIDAPPERKLIPRRKFEERLGCSRSTFYRLAETDESFPQPVRLRGLIMYPADEVDGYIGKLVAAR
jgi:predicted DNA-binding transcriptional regulator AlpA